MRLIDQQVFETLCCPARFTASEGEAADSRRA
jgi:hypothetical protein